MTADTPAPGCLTRAELDAIRARCEQPGLSPGPWSISKPPPWSISNAAFITHARTDIPRLLAHIMASVGGVIHACPPDGSGEAPCCGRGLLELPRADRMTLDPARVTCGRTEEAWDRGASSPEQFRVGRAEEYPSPNDPCFATEADATNYAIEMHSDSVLAVWSPSDDTLSLVWEGVVWLPQ